MVALCVEVQLCAADSGHEGVAVGPGGDGEVVVGIPVGTDVGRATVTGGGEHRDVIAGGIDVRTAQCQQ